MEAISSDAEAFCCTTRSNLQSTIGFFKIDGSGALSRTSLSADRLLSEPGYNVKAAHSTHGMSKMIEKGKKSGIVKKAFPVPGSARSPVKGGVALDLTKDVKGDGEMSDEDFERY